MTQNWIFELELKFPSLNCYFHFGYASFHCAIIVVVVVVVVVTNDLKCSNFSILLQIAESELKKSHYTALLNIATMFVV